MPTPVPCLDPYGACVHRAGSEGQGGQAFAPSAAVVAVVMATARANGTGSEDWKHL